MGTYHGTVNSAMEKRSLWERSFMNFVSTVYWKCLPTYCAAVVSTNVMELNRLLHPRRSLEI